MKPQIRDETSRAGQSVCSGILFQLTDFPSVERKRVFQVTQQRRQGGRNLPRSWGSVCGAHQIHRGIDAEREADCYTSAIFDVTPNRSVTLSSPLLLLPTAELMDSCRPRNPPPLRTGRANVTINIQKCVLTFEYRFELNGGQSKYMY